jgi:two-component system OmpR family response regulator
MIFDLPLKLLVVDDEPGVLKRIKELYTRKGLVVFIAQDGPTAVRIFEQESPQLCLIDIEAYSSLINGLGVLRKIKEIDEDTYCFMLAYSDQEEEMQQAKDLGAIECFVKPFHPYQFDKYIEMIESMFAVSNK